MLGRKLNIVIDGWLRLGVDRIFWLGLSMFACIRHCSSDRSSTSFCSLKDEQLITFQADGAIHYFFENISIHMGVDLGGGNIGMTEHLLHNPKVRASLKQVRSKGVSELMRREIPLVDTHQGRTPHNVVEGHTRDWLTLLADEDEITMLALQKFRARMFEIIGEGFFRMLTKGNQPLLATFTARPYDTEFKMEFLEAQSTHSDARSPDA